MLLDLRTLWEPISGTASVTIDVPTVASTGARTYATTTGAVGSVAVLEDVAIVGQAATGDAGFVSSGALTEAALTGVDASAAVGSVDASLILAGVSAAGAAGLVAVDLVVGVSGVEGTSATGGLGETESAAPSGVEATSGIGTLASALASSLVGEGTTGDVGTIAVDLRSHVIGAGLVGTVGVEIAVALAGSEATGALGVVALASGFIGTGDVVVAAPAIAGVGLGAPQTIDFVQTYASPRGPRRRRRPAPIVGVAAVRIAGPTIRAQGRRIPAPVSGRAVVLAHAGAVEAEAVLGYPAIGSIEGPAGDLVARGFVAQVTRRTVVSETRAIRGVGGVAVGLATVGAGLVVDPVDRAWQTLQRDHDEGADDEALLAILGAER